MLSGYCQRDQGDQGVAEEDSMTDWVDCKGSLLCDSTHQELNQNK